MNYYNFFYQTYISYIDLFSTLGTTVYNLLPLSMEVITRNLQRFFLQRLKHGRKALSDTGKVSQSLSNRRSRG